ncbi:MAG: transcriptional regulator [Rubritepida sp.]|nr:transcriptional regulator [Rubritepida sp.]
MSVETHAASEELGAVIRAARRRRGLTLQALADVIGVSHQQLQKYERGTNRVSGLRLAQIAALLGTTPDMLLAKPMGDAGNALLAAGCHNLEAGDYLREEEVSLLRFYRAIRSPGLREAVLICLRALADEAALQQASSLGPLFKKAVSAAESP